MLGVLLKRPLLHSFREIDSFCVGKIPSEWNGNEAIKCGHYHILKHCATTVTRKGADRLAEIGDLRALKILYDQGVICTSNGLIFAIRNGHVLVIRFLLDWYRFPVWNDILDEACKAGRIDIISFFQMKDYKFTSRSANIAAEYGRLELIHYFRSQNIHCTSIGLTLATRNRHHPVMIDLREHGIEETRYSKRYAQCS